MTDCDPPHLQPTEFTVLLGGVEFIPTPPGLTAAEAQHRLATWEPLKLCLQDYVVSDFEMGGTTIKANAHNGRLKRSTAALAAADRGTM